MFECAPNVVNCVGWRFGRAGAKTASAWVNVETSIEIPVVRKLPACDVSVMVEAAHLAYLLNLPSEVSMCLN